MVERDEWDRIKHREPVTFVERLAFALASHDIAGGEGRLEVGELNAVRFALRNTPWDHLPGGKEHRQELRRLLILEEGLTRKDKGDALLHAHLTMAYWPDYLGAAKAALSVLMIFPEVAKVISAEA